MSQVALPACPVCGFADWPEGGMHAARSIHMQTHERETLIQRLLNAKLAGQKSPGTYLYQFRSNESAAGLALYEIAAYLAEEAAALVQAAAINEESTGRSVQLIKAEALNDLAARLANS